MLDLARLSRPGRRRGVWVHGCGKPLPSYSVGSATCPQCVLSRARMDQQDAAILSPPPEIIYSRSKDLTEGLRN